ncbi:hypothetical protein [Paraburkholderia terrae]
MTTTSRIRTGEHLAWGKTVGKIRQAAHRDIKRVDQRFSLAMVVSA